MKNILKNRLILITLIGLSLISLATYVEARRTSACCVIFTILPDDYANLTNLSILHVNGSTTYWDHTLSQQIALYNGDQITANYSDCSSTMRSLGSILMSCSCDHPTNTFSSAISVGSYINQETWVITNIDCPTCLFHLNTVSYTQCGNQQ